jgi:hypothetical protein
VNNGLFHSRIAAAVQSQEDRMNWLENLSAWLGLDLLADWFERFDGGDGGLEMLLILLAASVIGVAFLVRSRRARLWIWRLILAMPGVRGARAR